jgi:hypothetical protein
LRIEDDTVHFLGNASCRIFRHGEAPRELGAGDDFGFLLRQD